MGGGNAQKSKTAREKNLEKNKPSKGSQLDSNKKAMSIQCKDSELFYECMRALKAFASFHYKETIARKASFKGSCFHSSFLPPFIMNFALRPLASILRSS